VLPIMLIGVTAYYAFSGMRKIFGKKAAGLAVSSAVAGVIGSLTNTALVLGMLYIVYAQEIIKRIDLADKLAVKTVIWSVVTTNGIIEAIISAIATTAIIGAYYAVYRNEINSSAVSK
ncbi:MAG: ECF transporter S component, partial [Vallitaleaceae bacterium]|nr:ECF transporter S component [Vallitaleaceae bacterium]